MASETTPLTSYGSVPTTIETVEQGTGFQEGSVYYLKEKTLTSKERFQKLVLVAVPLAVSLLIVGGAAYFLTRGFDSLYPAPGEAGHVNIPHFTPSTHTFDDAAPPSPPGPSPVHQPYGPPIASPVSTASTSSSSSSSSTGGGSSAGGDSDCSAHPKCSDLGLSGSCCPTGEGIVLGCC